MRRFFKKTDPKRPVLLSKLGKFQAFEAVDLEVGILSTSKEDIIEDLLAAIRNNVGAIEEIDEHAYNELRAQKKTDWELDSMRPWREELNLNDRTQQDTAERPLRPSEVGVVAERAAASNRPKYGTPNSEIIRPNVRKQQS